LIETQRLFSVQKRDRYDGEEATLVAVVKTYADDLRAKIAATLAHAATLSQSLDRTFPNRLLEAATDPLRETELRNKLEALNQRQSRLMEAGLLDKSYENTFISGRSFSDATLRILTEYVTDAEKKLAVYDNLLARIELLTRIINSRFQFKKLSVSRSDGFVFTDINQRKLSLESLSSGEQHEVVLTYDLLFKTQTDTLLLIDEPEISLHIA
jgi:predicted ATP-binding protein involved in virulence